MREERVIEPVWQGGAMAENKTQRNDGDVQAFLAGVANARRREDAQELCELMEVVTGDSPAMWGNSIVGFGEQHLKYASGRELDWMRIGFSPRKQNLTLYINEGFDAHTELLDRLGPHSTSVSCLYIKRLDAVDMDVLRELIANSYEASHEL